MVYVVTGKIAQLFYYNLSIGENRKDVSIQTLVAVKTCSYTPVFLC